MAYFVRRTVGLGALSVLAIVTTLLIAACGGGDEEDYAASQSHDAHESAPTAVLAGEHSETGLAGKKLFAANCTQCHGENAIGTNQGPPLVHQIYEPGHHGNASFVIAVARGVRAHHWDFGNMPAIPDLSIGEINQVICYVRELQLANDIIDEIPAATRC